LASVSVGLASFDACRTWILGLPRTMNRRKGVRAQRHKRAKGRKLIRTSSTVEQLKIAIQSRVAGKLEGIKPDGTTSVPCRSTHTGSGGAGECRGRRGRGRR
jgi:hypothetical protein